MKKNQWNGVMGLLGAAFLCGAVAVSEEMGWTDIGHRTLGITQLGEAAERQGLPPVEERVYGISRIWKMASDYYASWELADNEISWDEAYETAYREAVKASSAKEYYLVIRKFLAHLRNGSSDAVGGVNMNRWSRLPFLMEQRNGEFVVTATQDQRDYPMGAVITRVNGVETGTYLEETWGNYVGIQTPGAREIELCNLFFMAGETDEKVEVEIRRPGEEGTKLQKASWQKVIRNYVQENYTVKGEQRYHSDAFHVIQMEGNLMYLALKTEMDLGYIDEYFEKVVPILAEGEGVVLDVRKNTGGNSAIGHTIIESFMGSGIPECSSAPGTLKVSGYVNLYGVWSNAAQRTAKENWSEFAELYEQAQAVYGDQFQTFMDIGEEMHEGRFAVTEEMEELLEAEIQERMDGEEVWEPFETMWLDLVESSRVKGKPLVMLICSRTGASTDSTAASAKAAGVTLVGTRTKGSTGNLLVIDAGDGWYAAITTRRSLTPEGIDINNNGVEADVRVEIGAGDVVRGVDTQLVRAVEVLKEKISDQ